MSKPAVAKAAVWHPYNVDVADDPADDEPDDTQEMQIEDALKLYAAALKSHAEGPPAFAQTAAAYQALFESEIFKYTESLSEYQRHEVFGEELVFDSILEDDFEAGPVASASAADSAPNTLPQILHLSYKNHGQFLLEAMQHRHGQSESPLVTTRANTRSALTYFAEALDKEDTDLDLWMRAASVSAMLGSKRLTRYCLEAVLDGNDEQWENLLQLPGLEEGFAGQQLRQLVELLQDNVSLMQKPLLSIKNKKLSEALKKRLNPFPFAPLPAEVARAIMRTTPTTAPHSVTLTPARWDWAGIGEALLKQFMAEHRDIAYDVAPGSNIIFNVPPDSNPPNRIESKPSEQAASVVIAVSDQTTLVELTESPQREPGILGASAESEQTGTAEDDTMVEVSSSGAEVVKSDAGATTSLTEPAPALSRKRSTDSAGLPDTAEGGRCRSKRIRGRESIIEPIAGGSRAAQDSAKLLEEQLEPYTQADQYLYEITKDIYSRLGIQNIRDPSELRGMLTALPENKSACSFDKAACDFFLALKNGTAKGANIIMSSDSFDLLGITREAGLSAFLGFAKSGCGTACSKSLLCSQNLMTFTQNVNNNWLSVKEVLFAWVEALLSPGFFSQQQQSHTRNESSYVQFRWADDLKTSLVQIIVNADEYIHERMLERIETINQKILHARVHSPTYQLSNYDASQIEIVESLFELHLDVYSLIKHPHSQVDDNTRTLQSDRLERWSTLARDAMQLRSACDSTLAPEKDDLGLRHIWASVFQITINDEVPPEHIISAMAELKNIFHSLGDYTVQLQNNAVMPELSVAAIDRELVRISMKDFFLKVFDQDEQDPVAVIESLEPILDEPNPEIYNEFVESDQSGKGSISPPESAVVSVGTGPMNEAQIERPSPIFEMRKFLDSANVNVRLSLWHRLRVAYEAIEYPPKVVACHLRSIETLIKDFSSSNFQELPIQERQVKLLTRLRVIDDMVVKILRLFRDEPSAYDCLAYDHVQSSMSAIIELLRIMSAADVFRDLIRVDQIPMPRIEALPSQTFLTISAKLDDIHLHLWILQYNLLREGISQNKSDFPIPSDDLFEFLRHVHHATGVRHYCHQANRQFLRLEKDELLRLDDVIDGNSHAIELCQVLYDLYGLKLFVNPADCQEFSVTPDALDKKVAFSIMSFVMSQVAKVDLKDFAKTELKGTIEKVHAALGRPRSHDDIMFNRKIISNFFKSPISPISLYGCLRGVSSLPTKRIPAEEAVAASKGWYYMMGNIALSKFRSQKRMTQGPTEDLNYAQAFFVQDLEYTVDRWETWYRLAQANDAQLEEAVSWNADKLNSNSVDLVNFQRAAINCYIMAVACAVRDADTAPQIMDKVAQMFTEFGNRVYASSREPFSMEAFQIREAEKKFCNTEKQATYRDVGFVPLKAYTAWKFASTLFKRAVKGHPKKWWNHYMLGKCAWKMWAFNNYEIHYARSIGAAPRSELGPRRDEVVDALISAIETLPGKKGRSGEPILEPHYKLVSITHKLFLRRAINYEEGSEIMANSSYARSVTAPSCADDWERYILAVLKALRTADKSSWHHRITSRSAHILYTEGKNSSFASQAKHELTQQMFTKTMAVQVWKPEHERPGRHFVYTTRYTRYFLELLDLTSDKPNFEALAKRVRRKQSDFFEHLKLWQDLCSRYLRLLRRSGQVPDGQEETVFKTINQEEFNILALRMEAWCQNPANQHPILDLLRDVIELKRLNNGLMKPVVIDDLIGDTYALLYTLITPTLPQLPLGQQPQPAQPPPPPQPQPPAEGPLATSPQTTAAMPISSLMQVQVDGLSDKQATLSHLYQANSFNSHPPSQAPPQAELPSKSRAKAVGRREVARRAEACIQKVASTSAPQPTSIPIRSPLISYATLASLNDLPAMSEQTTPPQPPVAHETMNDHTYVPIDNGSATAVNSINHDEVQLSASTSVHEDADDESELSELDDDEVQEIELEVHKDGLLVRRPASVASIPFSTNMSTNESSFADTNKGDTVAVATEMEEEDEVESVDMEGGDEDTIHVLPREEDTVMQ